MQFPHCKGPRKNAPPQPSISERTDQTCAIFALPPSPRARLLAGGAARLEAGCGLAADAAAAPCGPDGGGLAGPRRASLLSDAALAQLAGRVVAFLRAAAQQGAALVDGRAVAVNEAAGAAVLDAAERLLHCI